jgi:hypothetical protein
MLSTISGIMIPNDELVFRMLKTTTQMIILYGGALPYLRLR